jgi:hypothetical protein
MSRCIRPNHQALPVERMVAGSPVAELLQAQRHLSHLLLPRPGVANHTVDGVKGHAAVEIGSGQPSGI